MRIKDIDFNPEEITYMGPFFTMRGKYYYRDTHNCLWELVITGWKEMPLQITPVTRIIDGHPK